MSGFDVIVVGGGLIGMMTARELANAGTKVALLEKGRTGRESSWAGGGILSPLYPWRYDDKVSALARWGQQHYPELLQTIADESGIDPEYRSSGLLILDTEERELARQWAEKWQATLRLVENDELKTIEPALADRYDSGLWLPEVGQVRNPRLAKALRQSLINKSVTILEDTPCESLLVTNNVIKGVKSANCSYYADNVVIAGGAWSTGILAETGITLEVKPVQGQMVLFRAEPDLVSRIVLSQDRYVIPRRDGRILVGSTLEDVGFAKQTSEQAKQELEAEAERIIPALANYPIEHHWAGLRPASPHGIPYICRHPLLEGLYINTGHFRNGVVLAPASCRLLADILLGKEPELQADNYAITLK